MAGLKGGLSFAGTESVEPRRIEAPLEHDVDASGYLAEDSDGGDDGEEATTLDTETPGHNSQIGRQSRKRTASSSVKFEQVAKKDRVAGGKPAMNKKVVVDYDSDDGRIITLKSQGYSDEYVSNQLMQEGRMRYVPRSIGSRWLRLRRVLEQAEEERLDDELSDWHIGEDEDLQASYEAISKKFEAEIQRLLNKKWTEVANNLAERLRIKKYTAKACQERFEGLHNGTALLPIEIDDDQEGRRELRETRIAEATQKRADHAAELQQAEIDRKLAAEKRKGDGGERERQAVLAAEKRKEQAEAKERRKQAKRDALENARAEKKAAMAHRKVEADWAKTKRDAEKALLARLRPKASRSKPVTAARMAARRSQFLVESGDEEESGVKAENGEEAATALENDAMGEIEDEAPDDQHHVKSTPLKPTPKPKAAQPPVTRETLLNPRSIMTFTELDTLLTLRHLPRHSSRETHAQLIARLAAIDAELSSLELTDLLRPFFDKGKGSKEAKCGRLHKLEAAASAAGLLGVASTDPEFIRGYEGYAGDHEGVVGDDDVEMEG